MSDSSGDLKKKIRPCEAQALGSEVGFRAPAVADPRQSLSTKLSRNELTRYRDRAQRQ